MDIFIDDLIISPIYVNFTFKATNSIENDKNALFFNTLLKSLGIVIANVDNCPIELSGIRLSKCYDSQKGIKS
jgi:hypothetical protein